MVRKIVEIKPTVPLQPKPKRAAAYVRVSTGSDEMLHSLSAQTSYYSRLIQNHDGWVYAGVYADEALTGTKGNRKAFVRLKEDCMAGKIDVVVTKSISRFARNTVTLLETVREFKSKGIDVYFEEQNIHTLSADGELMMTILASYAQEESLSVSENQKWRVRKNFEAGLPWHTWLIGYKFKDGTYEVFPEEAKIVKQIFTDYLSGMGYTAIAKKLNNMGCHPKRGDLWNPNSISKILRNVTYTGNLLLQKTFSENHLTKRKIMNEGQMPKYWVENTHEAIIPMEMFEAVQAEILRRSEGKRNTPKKQNHHLAGLLVCGMCGKPYHRKTTAGGKVWVCPTFNSMGKKFCPSKQIPEPIYESAIKEVLGIKEIMGFDFQKKLTKIQADNGNLLTFYFTDGTTKTFTWKDRSRSESWTPEMKEKASKKAIEREAKKRGKQ